MPIQLPFDFRFSQLLSFGPGALTTHDCQYPDPQCLCTGIATADQPGNPHGAASCRDPAALTGRQGHPGCQSVNNWTCLNELMHPNLMGASHPDGKCARQISANGTAFAGLGCLGRATQHEIALPMDHERVNQAIRDCLQHCYQASQVLPVIAGFMAGMKAAGGWDDDEIRVVEIGVHKILGGIVAAPIYPGDATNVSSGDVGRGGSETTKLSGA